MSFKQLRGEVSRCNTVFSHGKSLIIIEFFKWSFGQIVLKMATFSSSSWPRLFWRMKKRILRVFNFSKKFGGWKVWICKNGSSLWPNYGSNQKLVVKVEQILATRLKWTSKMSGKSLIQEFKAKCTYDEKRCQTTIVLHHVCRWQLNWNWMDYDFGHLLLKKSIHKWWRTCYEMFKVLNWSFKWKESFNI